jgi:sensor histidine kinase regulating citrate/malate metabolism
VKLFRLPIKLGLRAKITLLIESLVVLLVVSTGIITTVREKKTLESELRKRGLALAVDLSKYTARPMLANDLPTLRRFVIHTMDQDNVRYVFLMDPQGKVIMHSDLAEVGKIYRDDVNVAAVNATDRVLPISRGKANCIVTCSRPSKFQMSGWERSGWAIPTRPLRRKLPKRGNKF